VIPRGEASRATLHPSEQRGSRNQPAPLARARIVPRPLAEARLEAERLLARAREEARQIVVRAEAAAHDLGLQLEGRARADALCLVVSEALEFRKRREELSRHALDRSIGFATLLAERLLGEELALSAERIRALARQALTEAAGARHALLVAHPLDASELRAGLANLGTLFESIGVEDDARLARGHIRVETELGVIEADLRGQLARLALQLKKIVQTHAADGS
jgi:flagellar biosynthesis/type III secretory pathway protein FliH